MKKAMNNKDTITAEEIRAIRESRGLNARQFSALIGVSESVVSRWEGGKRPARGTAVKLLRALQAASSLLEWSSANGTNGHAKKNGASK